MNENYNPKCKKIADVHLQNDFAMEAKSYQPGMVVTQQMLSIFTWYMLVVTKRLKPYAAMTLSS